MAWFVWFLCFFWCRYAHGSKEGKLANTWLADGLCGILVGVLGDLDYMASTLQLPRWSRKENCCALCQCTSTGHFTWKSFKATSPWITTCWIPSTWSSWEHKSTCLLFEVRGLTACNVACGYMHSKYLGTDMVCFASILWLAIYTICPGSPKQNLAFFESHLKEHYRLHKVASRFTSFSTFRLFVNKKGLKLKGKAAQVKSFGWPLLTFSEKVYNQEVSTHKLILLYLKLNFKLESLLDENKDEFALGHLS